MLNTACSSFKGRLNILIQNQMQFMDDMWAGSQYMSSTSLSPLALGGINISGSSCSVGESFGLIFMHWKEAETPRSSLFTCMKKDLKAHWNVA